MSRPGGAGERVYRFLVRAYPPRFRERYGHELALAFRDAHRDAERGARGARFRFWIGIVLDLARSVPAQRVGALRRSWEHLAPPTEGLMKTMGILAVLIGALQAINAVVELSASGVHAGAFPLGVVFLALLLGVLLVGAGVAMLGRSRLASPLAQASAIAWLVLVVLVRAVHPWMSIVTTILAVVFPVALLLFFQLGRGRRTPGTA
jgi:hypothetical protein